MGGSVNALAIYQYMQDFMDSIEELPVEIRWRMVRSYVKHMLEPDDGDYRVTVEEEAA